MLADLSWMVLIPFLTALSAVQIAVHQSFIQFLQTYTFSLENDTPNLPCLVIWTLFLPATAQPGDLLPLPVLGSLQLTLQLPHVRGTPLKILRVDNSRILHWEDTAWTALSGLIEKLVRDGIVYNILWATIPNFRYRELCTS
ncbi:hypothetical protein C8J57DRAFT_1725163 [Mycena rebaudengoi]|nr:hypothetical protein C8J57DRAFT_1725163 [Mycena rebaudengoi]